MRQSYAWLAHRWTHLTATMPIDYLIRYPDMARSYHE